MIMSMPTTACSQQRYDHRGRNLVQRTVAVPDYHFMFGIELPNRFARLQVGRTSGSWNLCTVMTPSAKNNASTAS